MNTTTGLGLIIVGVALTICGALFTFITLGFGIICAWPFIFVGFILIIIGIIVSLLPESKPIPIIIQQPQQAQAIRYCTNCGRSLQSDTHYCPFCGKKIT
jgi:hypothetical protein